MLDWKAWANFWVDYTQAGLRIPRPLGNWLDKSHITWQWYWDADSSLLQRCHPSKIEYYLPAGMGRTRSSAAYVLTSTHTDGRSHSGVPCSVETIDSNAVRLHSIGPSLCDGPPDPSKFFDFLSSWGGEWMWSNVKNDDTDMRWVLQAIRNGSGIWCTDGSYNRPIAPHVSGAGWVFYCTVQRKKLQGSFYEFSPSAGSYRGELLGLLAIHILMAALEEYFQLDGHTAKICCDNQGALFKSSELRRRIPTGASQADIKRVLRNVKHKIKSTFTYEWVQSHQDRYKFWHQLTIEQQLNCHCDSTAKAAVQHSLHCLDPWSKKQVLPCESAAVFVRGIKQTTDVARDVRFTLGLHDARALYTTPLGPRDAHGRRHKSSGLGWSKASFDAVDWEALDATLRSKPQMYQQWLAKQSSGFCGTQSMVARWNPARDGKCPNCGEAETSAHLNRCSSEGRTTLHTEMTDDLKKWLYNNFAHPELAYWIPRYILLRGTSKLSDFPHLSPEMTKVALQQDLIPWKHFMEGKICLELFKLQSHSLACSPSRLSGGDWAKQLITRILHISHGQWVFRNTSLHHETQGYLRLQERTATLATIDRLSTIDPADIPDESKYLLEMDFSSLRNNSLEQQSYWVYAMKAAFSAGRRTTHRSTRTMTPLMRRQHQRSSIQRNRATSGTLDLGTGRLSQPPALPSRHQSRHRSYIIPGVTETLQSIRLDWNDVDPPPPAPRQSEAVTMALMADNKRRMPD